MDRRKIAPTGQILNHFLHFCVSPVDLSNQMFKTVITILVCSLYLSGCLAKRESEPCIASGTWRASVTIQDHELPFNIDVEERSGGYRMYLRNAEERIMLDEITVWGDSVDIVLHVFDANFKAKIKGDTMTGEFVKNYAVDYRLPFKAIYNQTYRFPEKTDDVPVPDYSGKYAVKFFDAKDTVPAIGIFEQEGTYVTGTFLTPTGDYRYLEGNVGDGGKLNLSTFDGNHTYLFSAPPGHLAAAGRAWPAAMPGDRAAPERRVLQPGFRPA
jgi:hypothetical protein